MGKLRPLENKTPRKKEESIGIYAAIQKEWAKKKKTKEIGGEQEG